MKIAINTGGGDAPGLNAVIRAVVLSATKLGWGVFGIRRGYQGLFENDGVLDLTRESVRGITHLGGDHPRDHQSGQSTELARRGR